MTPYTRNVLNGVPLYRNQNENELWDHTPCGQSSRLHLSHRQKPELLLETKFLQWVYANFISQKRKLETHELYGYLSHVCDAFKTSISVMLRQEDVWRADEGRPRIKTISARIVIVDKTIDFCWPEIEYTRDLEMLQKNSQNMPCLDVSELLKLRAICVTNGVRCDVAVEMASMSMSFVATPICAVPIRPNQLSMSLTTSKKAVISTGFLSMDAAKRLVFIVEDEENIENLPLIGIWISGVCCLLHPYVWAACVRYISSTQYKNRLCVPPMPFLLVTYTVDTLEPTFYDCVIDPNSSGSPFISYRAEASIDLTKDLMNLEFISTKFVQIEDTYRAAENTIDRFGTTTTTTAKKQVTPVVFGRNDVLCHSSNKSKVPSNDIDFTSAKPKVDPPKQQQASKISDQEELATTKSTMKPVSQLPQTENIAKMPEEMSQVKEKSVQPECENDVMKILEMQKNSLTCLLDIVQKMMVQQAKIEEWVQKNSVNKPSSDKISDATDNESQKVSEEATQQENIMSFPIGDVSKAASKPTAENNIDSDDETLTIMQIKLAMMDECEKFANEGKETLILEEKIDEIVEVPYLRESMPPSIGATAVQDQSSASKPTAENNIDPDDETLEIRQIRLAIRNVFEKFANEGKETLISEKKTDEVVEVPYLRESMPPSIGAAAIQDQSSASKKTAESNTNSDDETLTIMQIKLAMLKEWMKFEMECPNEGKESNEIMNVPNLSENMLPSIDAAAVQEQSSPKCFAPNKTKNVVITEKVNRACDFCASKPIAGNNTAVDESAKIRQIQLNMLKERMRFEMEFPNVEKESNEIVEVPNLRSHASQHRSYCCQDQSSPKCCAGNKTKNVVITEKANCACDFCASNPTAENNTADDESTKIRQIQLNMLKERMRFEMEFPIVEKESNEIVEVPNLRSYASQHRSYCCQDQSSPKCCAANKTKNVVITVKGPCGLYHDCQYQHTEQT